jgi:hypothetical protein
VRKSAQIPVRTVFAILVSAAIISIFPGHAQLAGDDGPAAQALAERLGKDDGFALSVLYSGDLHGSLETCG